ncbi:PIG-L family deacetylase [Virgibacillus sp. MG-45]|uniref:PIG-L family deacetylase n=1 Tax=Virgibacillus sp. MG-45 TaxID=3102791 RepID=UPI002ED8723A
MKKTLYILLVALLTLLPTSSFAKVSEKHDVELWNVVNPLQTTVTFLNTGAHPDDERSDFLAYLSRGLGVKTASLIANRGEGGQNEIGNELGNALGIIRSNEMVEAAKITGVKAFHLSETTSDAIYDFGFSKSPNETLEKWGEEVTYERLIRFIRTYQPDIVMPSFRNVNSQHGHHRAMTILSERAFEDAADPSVFPEHLEDGLHVWQVKKFYLPAVSEETATTSIEIGDYDPIYDMTYPQLGEASRYMHKSQGMGKDIPAEPRQTHLELVASVLNDEEADLFSGIPYNFEDWAEVVEADNERLSEQLEALQEALEDIVEAYPNRAHVLPKSQQALKDVRKLLKFSERADLSETVKNDLVHKLEIKEKQLQDVSFVAADLEVKTDINSQVLTPGEEATISVSITNKGAKKIHHMKAGIAIPESWNQQNEKYLKHVKPNETKTVTFKVNVPEDAELFAAYDDPIVQAEVSFKEQGVTTVKVVDLDNTVSVLPELSVKLDPENITVNTAAVQEEIPVRVNVKSYTNSKIDGNVSLKLPDGWTSEPTQQEVTFHNRFEEKELTFTVHPPAQVEAGDFSIDAIASANGKTFTKTVQEIKYEHINDSYFLYEAKADGVAFELLKPDNLKVGYIESGFDKVADYLQNAGFDITKLTETDLATGDLTQYDTIVTGIRANLSREDLVQNNPRLLEYVENGGHLVVQYHKPWDNWDTNSSAPYQLEIGQPSIEWRVTDENAAVTMTKPNHKLFNYPNTITDRDWDNWVQERGLYFPMNWSDQYETFVQMADPGEEAFDGGILLANYGEGTYLYTNLVFYRQIDNQVPGGYRIFTNLISYGIEE